MNNPTTTTTSTTNGKVDENLSGPDDENIRTRSICAYLHCLRERLRAAFEQHNSTIKNSVSIIKEIADVSTMLALTEIDSGLHSKTRIKRMILEFEGAHVLQVAESKSHGLSSNDLIDLRQLLDDFERLNESQLLRESLLVFKRAKDSFEKVVAFLDKFGEDGDDSASPSPQTSEAVMACSSKTRSLRDRIHAFNKASEQSKNIQNEFTTFFSSTTSMHDIFTSATAINMEHGGSCTNSMAQSGYEGDVSDSELEQMQEKPLNT